MRKVITYFIESPVSGNLLMLLIFFFGYQGLVNMKSTFFPETESRIINIQAVYPGSGPEEIERGIVLKIEENLKGLTGVERVSSVSRENVGSVTVEVLKGYDTDLILQDVKNAVDGISAFPSGMEPPTIFKRESVSLAISFALSGDLSLGELKTEARRVEDELRNSDFITKVSLSGFPDEEIEISFREADLQRLNLTFNEATVAVRAANLDITGGTVKGEREELLVRARKKEFYAKDLEDIPLKAAANGAIIRLADVATVRDKWADNPSRSYLNGAPSVVISVSNTVHENILDITEYVRDYVIEFNKKNENVKAEVIRDRSVSLNQRIDLLSRNGIQGFIMVLILLAMFLNWRLAFWVALSIPISFAGMFFIGYGLSITINVISLFGMILVIGILVDDGIVIAENIYQHYEKGEDRKTAAINGTLEVLPAVFSAILTTVVAFSTFFFIDGRLGDIFFEMAIVVILCLVFSLVEGAFILPGHVSHSNALMKDKKMNVVSKGLDNFMNWMRRSLYGPILKFCMYNKLFAFALPLALMFMTMGALQGGIIKSTFFPFIDRDDISVSLKMPAGTREKYTKEWLDHIEKAIWEVNEDFKKEREDGLDVVLQVEKNIGSNAYDGSINIGLLDGETRELNSILVANAVREKAGTIIGAENVSYGTNSVFGKAVSISLLGNDYVELGKAVEEMKKELSEIAELKDVIDNNQAGLREINVTLKDKALLLGLDLQTILGQVRAGFFGSEVQRLQRGRDEVRVWVRYEEGDRSNIGKLENMRIRLPGGQEYPLYELAEFEIKRGIVAINHIDGKREIKVESDISSANASVSDITELIKTEIGPRVMANYPTVTAVYEGQNKEQEKSQKSMGKVLPIILIIMFAIIILTFRSVSQAIVVFVLIPFGLIGVGWGHYFLGAPISLFSILGVIALVGILVNDALVFITAYNTMIKENVDHMTAVYEAGLSRFRPIILTSATTIAGLAPLVFFEKSFQAQFLIPMAISVAFGLVLATVIILILLPVLLIVINRYKVYVVYLFQGKKPAYEKVEPHGPDKLHGVFLMYLFSVWVILGLLYLLSKIPMLFS